MFCDFAGALSLDFWPPELWENKFLFFFLYLLKIYFLFCHIVWHMELPRPGIESIPYVVEVQS